ncbi:glycosyltransferase family 2 protein [[Mycoplasma] mobile]|uniref:Putative glycosyltransferase n=1 Tax=Mycoplasma mobile (strain ATCC 43663 / 163K / NCTC 11711) TaxID=267748 RepID=Q6KHM3_MYCM1|nr:glycosyltransferase family 2 protein [[Mycoplasma] mobile]AAT27907.1 putative glycosyltransferase [Mycoplasma mobile 163K]
MNQNNHKILFTFVIPSYNAEKHLDISLPSILNQTLYEANVMNDYEIIVVNDGSKDKTSEVAKQYIRKWNAKVRPDFVLLIEKENGQYGSVINQALEVANGIYFKVLDADDSFDTKILIDIINMIRGQKKLIDVLLVDYSMEKVANNKKIIISHKKNFQPYKILSLRNLKFPYTIITMHSIFYRTNFLKDLNYKQIEGIYYSDSQYSLIPFSQAETMYYMNDVLYRYYIGRSEQSINLKNMVKNRNHQFQVIHKILETINIEKINSDSFKKYTWNFIRQMILWQIMLISFDRQIKNKRVYLLNFIKDIKRRYPLISKHILKGFSIKTILFVRGHFISTFVKIGVKIYSKFGLNILAEWE